MLRQASFFAIVAGGLLLLPYTVHGATSFVIRVRPAGTSALYSTLAFDVSHSDTACRNRVTFIGFSSEGNPDSATVEAGPGYGDLLSASNPAALTTLEAQYFYNSLAVPFDSLRGTTIVRITVSEEGPTAPASPDEVSMYLIDRNSGLPTPTADEFGTAALFAIDITGAAGGELTVFSPMVFIPPDTLTLQGSVDDVPRGDVLGGRLRIVGTVPNPAGNALRVDYILPRPGGRPVLSVIDVDGRRITTIRLASLPPGRGSATWPLRDHGGRPVPPGVYFVKLELDGQTAIRRVVVNR